MSEHSNNPETKSTPGWVAYLFFLVLAIGVGAAVYHSVFRPQSRQAMIREAMGTETIKATIEIIPVRDAAAIANGQKSFERTCFACHGKDLMGTNAAPNLKDSEWLHPPASETALYKLVSNGVPPAEGKFKPGSTMPPKGGSSSMSSVEVWEVIYYLSSKNSSIEKDAVSNVK